MNNKLLAALAMTTALATSAHSACQINSGAYVGLSAGGAHLAGKNDFTYENVVGGIKEEKGIKLSKTSVVAGIFGGYGFKFNNLWAAAELFYQFDQLKDSSIFSIQGNSGSKLESKSSGSYGGAVHLGFIPNGNSIVYAIIGLDVKRFKVSFSDTVSPAIINASISKSYTSPAFAPGIGVRLAVSKNISIRTEYKCAIHRKKSFDAAAVGGLGTDAIKVKHSPTVHSFNVGLVYSF